MSKDDTFYHPKGGMCAGCIHKHRDCSHLPFHSYPLIREDKFGIVPVVIVRCLEYKNMGEINTAGLIHCGK